MTVSLLWISIEQSQIYISGCLAGSLGDLHDDVTSRGYIARYVLVHIPGQTTVGRRAGMAATRVDTTKIMLQDEKTTQHKNTTLLDKQYELTIPDNELATATNKMTSVEDEEFSCDTPDDVKHIGRILITALILIAIVVILLLVSGK